MKFLLSVDPVWFEVIMWFRFKHWCAALRPYVSISYFSSITLHRWFCFHPNVVSFSCIMQVVSDHLLYPLTDYCVNVLSVAANISMPYPFRFIKHIIAYIRNLFFLVLNKDSCDSSRFMVPLFSNLVIQDNMSSLNICNHFIISALFMRSMILFDGRSIFLVTWLTFGGNLSFHV